MTKNTHEPVYASVARPWLKYYDEKYINQTVPDCTAFELVCRNNDRHLGETALEYYGRKLSYADLIVQVKKTAAALRGLGVKKGDIITVVSVMTPEVIYCFYAADLLGATLNLVDPRYSTDGIREYIEEVESRLLICLNVVYARCHQAAKRTIAHVAIQQPGWNHIANTHDDAQYKEAYDNQATLHPSPPFCETTCESAFACLALTYLHKAQAKSTLPALPPSVRMTASSPKV